METAVLTGRGSDAELDDILRHLLGPAVHLLQQFSGLRHSTADAVSSVQPRILRSRPSNRQVHTHATHDVVVEQPTPLQLLTPQSCINVLCGAAARTLAACSIIPVDVIKTRLQASVPVPQLLRWQHSVNGALRNTPGASNLWTALLARGPGDLFLGGGAVLLGTVPSAAAYHLTYELLHRKLKEHDGRSEPIAHSLAALTGAFTSAFVKVPVDTIKHRVQVYSFPNAFAAARGIVATQGISGLYSGFAATLMRDMPEILISFTLYAQLRNATAGWRSHAAAAVSGEDSDAVESSSSSSSSSSSDRKGSGRCASSSSSSEPPPIGVADHMLLGGCAGAVSSLVTTPLDVLKVQIQCGGATGGGVGGALQSLLAKRGPAGLFAGWRPRVAQTALTSAIFFAAYEVSRAHVAATLAAKAAAEAEAAAAAEAASCTNSGARSGGFQRRLRRLFGHGGGASPEQLSEHVTPLQVQDDCSSASGSGSSSSLPFIADLSSSSADIDAAVTGLQLQLNQVLTAAYGGLSEAKLGVGAGLDAVGGGMTGALGCGSGVAALAWCHARQ